MDQTPEATQYALRVALQTMKERCQILQKRLSTLEDENQNLRAGKDDNIKSTSSFVTTPNVGFAAENFQLRLQLAELEKQKSQLTEQINMVSTENRKLWSRLSQMAKDQDGKNVVGDNDEMLNSKTAELSRSGGANQSNQNLIRSKTFTQHSPNPNLRHKLISTDIANLPTNIKDLSLEEVTLNNDDVTGSEEMAAVASAAEIGFSYLNIDESSYKSDANTDIIEAEVQQKAQKCVDGLQELRREALQQQKELQTAIAALKQRLATVSCPDCAQKSKKPEMADKSLETDESLTEALHASQSATAAAADNTAAVYSDQASGVDAPRLNFIQEKIEADSRLKTCPMCAKVYNESVSFKDFCEHVESHFTSETSDFGSMIEHDFECISNTVGNF